MSQEKWLDLGDALSRALSGGHRDAVPHDRYDDAAWDFARAELDSLEAMVVELGKEYDYVEDFLADLFHAAMKGDPQVRDRAQMVPTHVPNQYMIEYFRNTPDWVDLRRHTVGSMYSAVMAMLSMRSEIESVFERMARARELADELAQLKARVADLSEAAEVAVLDADGAGAHAALLSLSEAMDALSNLAAVLDATAQDEIAAVGLLVQGAVRSAAGQAQEEADLLSAFGQEDGLVQRMSFAERAALVARLRGNRLARFASFIGAFRTMGRAETRRRVLHEPSEIVGVVLSDDLTRLVPAETEAMATPELEDDFWLRYTEHRLLTYLLRGSARQGRGPMILVCDESDSMNVSDLGGVTREAWSKGLCLALVDAARRERRPVVYIGFSSARQQWTVDLSSGDLDSVIEMTEHMYAGGTHFETPLQMALAITAQWTQAGRPDVVFITDDDYNAPTEEFIAAWSAARAEHSIRCWGVHIGGRVSGALAAVSDSFFEISELAHDVTSVAPLFRSL